MLQAIGGFVAGFGAGAFGSVAYLRHHVANVTSASNRLADLVDGLRKDVGSLVARGKADAQAIAARVSGKKPK